jgi:hypothetical protein
VNSRREKAGRIEGENTFMIEGRWRVSLVLFKFAWRYARQIQKAGHDKKVCKPRPCMQSKGFTPS